MPKKGKKGKKGKGKGKGKKGKNGGKKAKKTESVTSMAIANSLAWEARLEVLEKSKKEYRENAKKLMLENDALQNQIMRSEHDTIDVITHLKKQDLEKDMKLDSLQNQIRELRIVHCHEKEAMIEDFSKQINDLEEKLGEKMREIELMQNELKMVKEFRRKRGQMQRELDEIKDSLHNANREHKSTLANMEQKFFEEKMRLQQEANQKIAELAEKAHTEAIANLDETTKSVYKENVRLSESLNYHMKEGDMLKHERQRLSEQNEKLMSQKELSDTLVQEKVIQAKQHKETIKGLQEKVHTLEKSLSHVVKEFETERKLITDSARTESEAARVELAKLQRVIEMKTKEMNKVKRLAKNILDQRTELERFFLEALEQVKTEVAANQAQYRRDAQFAYLQKMQLAQAGKGEFPKIRTFINSETSTNSVFKDTEAAERLYGVTGNVDVSDLTWEQKERVLRYLFARMNGTQQAVTSFSRQHVLPAIQDSNNAANTHDEAKDEATKSDATFLTQTHVDIDTTGSLDPVLPKLPVPPAQQT